MKVLAKAYIVSVFSIFVSSRVFGGMVFESGIKSILLTGVGLAAVSFIVKPLINILLLPLNLITFGLFKWVSSAIALYLVTLVVPGFKIINFAFSGFSSKWFDIPDFSLPGVLALVAFSFVISVFGSIIHWVIE